MADLKMDFCGVPFKNPVVIASLETTNSPDLMKQAFDYGASGAIIKTLTDIDDMAVLTMNSKYAIMNDRGDIIKGKVHLALNNVAAVVHDRVFRVHGQDRHVVYIRQRLDDRAGCAVIKCLFHQIGAVGRFQRCDNHRVLERHPAEIHFQISHVVSSSAWGRGLVLCYTPRLLPVSPAYASIIM